MFPNSCGNHIGPEAEVLITPVVGPITIDDGSDDKTIHLPLEEHKPVLKMDQHGKEKLLENAWKNKQAYIKIM